MKRRRLLLGGGAAIAAPLFSRWAHAADAPRFGLGVASGQPRPDGMVLWTRLMGDALPPQAAVSWEVADDAGFEKIVARGVETAEAASAHTVHAEPSGLAADRWYFYRFAALGDRSPVGRTRSAPGPDAAATLKLALASCQRFDDGHYAAWRQVAEDGPDLVAFVGDYIYESAQRADRRPVRPLAGGVVRTLDEYRARYATHKSDPSLQAAHAAAPWLVVWDDHEVENDYAGLRGLGNEAGFPDRRAAAYQAYWEHMPFPKTARPAQADMRIYGRLDWGRLARVHLLDDRQYRDPQACQGPGGGARRVLLRDCADLGDPRRSLLGEAQERWLVDGLDLERPWNLIVQQTLMARSGVDEAARDRVVFSDGWDGYSASRDRLLKAIGERKLGGAVVLGGDVHAHFVADLKADFDDPRSATVASEFCGTSISSYGMQQRRAQTMKDSNPHIKYANAEQRGYVGLTLDSGRLSARMQAVERSADPASPVVTAARFAVAAGRPGVQPG